MDRENSGLATKRRSDELREAVERMRPSSEALAARPRDWFVEAKRFAAVSGETVLVSRSTGKVAPPGRRSRWDVSFTDQGCEISLKVSVPLPAGLPPPSELQLQTHHLPTLELIEGRLPEFVAELLFAHLRIGIAP